MDRCIAGAPLGDHRKFVIRRILAPYLTVVKRLPYGECVKIINDWLVRCNCVERLRFNAKYNAEKYLKNAKRVGYRPISLENYKRRIIPSMILYSKEFKIEA
jgi:hypothetical protein